MKKCGSCGAEYPDDLIRCPVDQQALMESFSPDSAAPSPGFIASLLALRDDSQTVPVTFSDRPVKEFLVTFARYFAALIFGCIIGVFVVYGVFYGLDVIAWLVPDRNGLFMSLVWAMPALAFFTGVFAGTLCLPRDRRAFGSISLFIIGMAGYFMTFFFFFWALAGTIAGPDSYSVWFVNLPPLIGGLLAVLFFNWGRWPKFSRRNRS